jgi:small-conductance mechanosensitive channel
MPNAYIEDLQRTLTTQQEKLRVELEQLQASARRLSRPPESGTAPAQRIAEVRGAIAALGAAVKALTDDQMIVEKLPNNLTEAESFVQATFMSLAANPADANYGRIQGRDVLDPAEQ